MPWLKLVNVVAVLFWVGWMYARHGWRAGYMIGSVGQARLDDDGQTIALREQQTRFGWPIWALLERPSPRRRNFLVRPASRRRFRRAIQTGIPAFRDAFSVAPSSHVLESVLLQREPVFRHLLKLQRLLDSEGSRLSHVAAEGDTFRVELNVRWVRDRPRLYRKVITWLGELERLLIVEADAAG